MKTCTKCLESLEDSSFYKDKRKKSGLSSWCVDCHKINTREWKKNNRHITRGYMLIHRFGITTGEYTAMLEQQGGLCAICNREETVVANGSPRRLAVDHDRSCCPGTRSCGECIRGLLCHSCNTGIGKLDDSIERLQSAIQYINKHKILKGEK